jgi:hypothetical protein
MSSRRSPRTCLGLTIRLAVVLALASVSSASAATTIGQLPQTAPLTNCSGSASDFIEPTVTSGAPYVVPAGSGQAITSWSTFAAQATGQVMTMKVLHLVTGSTYKVVGHDGPKNLASGTLQTFQTNIPVEPGDILGFSHGNNSAIACSFPAPGETAVMWSPGTDVPDGDSATFSPATADSRLNLSAVVGAKTSNDFDFGNVKKNKGNGTATIAVDVPGPGTLSLTGIGVKAQRVAGATISKDVPTAGTYKLKIKAKGQKKSKLKKTGKVKVKIKVTFKPATANGDLASDPNSEPKKIKLVDN